MQSDLHCCNLLRNCCPVLNSCPCSPCTCHKWLQQLLLLLPVCCAIPPMAGPKSRVLHSSTSRQCTLQLTRPHRPRGCTQHRSRDMRARSSSSAGAAGDNPDQQRGPDLVSSMLDSCLSATARVADTAVGRLADVLQSVAPAAAPRHKIELSVKGALLLLLLGLLKGVISFVLLVGCIGLAVYTATQVFGWSGVVLSQTGSGYGRSSYRQQQYAPDQPPPGPGYQQGYAGRQSYRQQQQQYGHPQPGWREQGRQFGDQDDVVDVFHYPRPASY